MALFCASLSALKLLVVDLQFRSESAIAGHDGTMMVQNSRDRIFFGPGEAGFEKNCKVNPRTFAFLKDLGGGSTDKFHALFSYFHMVDFTFHFYPRIC